MSFWIPRTSKTGGLPHISFVKRKPRPLGTEFKNVACAETGVMLHLELQRGKEPMKHSDYHRELGATAACTLRMGLATKNCGQSTSDDSPKDIFYGDSWFASVKTATKMHEHVSSVRLAAAPTIMQSLTFFCQLFITGHGVCWHCQDSTFQVPQG